MCAWGRWFRFPGASAEAHHNVLEATSTSGTVDEILVESFWKKIEALENQRGENFVLNFQKKKVKPASRSSAGAAGCCCTKTAALTCL